MIDISLTDFVDFVIGSGTPKLTKVRQVKARPEYNPAHDYWKPLRDGITKFHRDGGVDKNELDDILVSVSDKKKLARYPDCIASYKKFLGKKRFEWFVPPRNTWGPEGIRIRINPELGLMRNGTDYVIKLYFKAEKLSKRRTDAILLLMETALRPIIGDEVCFALLDVSNAHLYSNPADASLLPLLIGEATSFAAIWNALE